MTDPQSTLIAKAREIRSRFPKWAEEADKEGLKLFAREYDWLGNQLEIAIDNQIRTLEKGQAWEEKTETQPNERKLDFG